MRQKAVKVAEAPNQASSQVEVAEKPGLVGMVNQVLGEIRGEKRLVDRLRIHGDEAAENRIAQYNMWLDTIERLAGVANELRNKYNSSVREISKLRKLLSDKEEELAESERVRLKLSETTVLNSVAISEEVMNKMSEKTDNSELMNIMMELFKLMAKTSSDVEDIKEVTSDTNTRVANDPVRKLRQDMMDGRAVGNHKVCKLTDEELYQMYLSAGCKITKEMMELSGLSSKQAVQYHIDKVVNK